MVKNKKWTEAQATNLHAKKSHIQKAHVCDENTSENTLI